MTSNGAYPPGCAQRDVDMAQPGYWGDDPQEFEPECACCDDVGCLECCPTEPITLEDLEQIECEIQESETRIGGRTAFGKQNQNSDLRGAIDATAASSATDSDAKYVDFAIRKPNTNGADT